MKKIEKEIKKNSTELIESSLPEIDSLDKVPVKTKTNKKWPILFAPLGAIVLALTAIIIPLALKDVAPLPIVPPTNSTSAGNPSNSYSITYYSNNNGSSNNPIGSSKTGYNNNQPVTHTYNFNFADYQPTFDNFNEVAYYSYLAYEEESSHAIKNAPRNRINLKAENEEAIPNEEDDRSSYIDAYGRLHYPIPLADEYTFSNFLFFEFNTTYNSFLAERIGNGHIYGLALDLSIFGEKMLILKNGESYYSCLCNGAGNNGLDNAWRIEFSAHKTIEEFDLVKDATNKRYLTLTIDDQDDFTTLSTINIEGSQYRIKPETVHYDNIAITCSFEAIREHLELNPEYRVINGYGGNDALVYDAESGNNTFTLDEFEGEFLIDENGVLLLDYYPALSVHDVTKIYACEVNKDFHRDLVYETVENEKRYFNVFDVKNGLYLYRNLVSNIGDYFYYLDMLNDRVVVKLLEPETEDDDYMLDYGYFAYYESRGVTIVWQNYFEITGMRLTGVFEEDGVTPVELIDTYYHFNSNTPYILEISINKYPGYKNPNYPSVNEHPLACIPYDNGEETPSEIPSISFLSMENGVYRYQIMYQEKGIFCCAFSFYRYSFDLRAAVDEPVIVEQ